ncbi:unnamed protein product [Nyctereutes procyonoides]|uniref:(raccoon dog) hypothetical protein n=1 Tax=Nyctereutes procyonoides TaxID=34880 RepID=A0A811Y8V2_NYCPR|nr:unnamed protein product [Nyctereutes procyonoides]
MGLAGAVNLSQNGRALQEACIGVGNGRDICMEEELHGGKVMDAFWRISRVKDPKSSEGVNDVWKGVCTNHVSMLASFLKGPHMEPECIRWKVARASGHGPLVDSVYQKTGATSEIGREEENGWLGETQWAEEERQLQEEHREQEPREASCLEQCCWEEQGSEVDPRGNHWGFPSRGRGPCPPHLSLVPSQANRGVLSCRGSSPKQRLTSASADPSLLKARGRCAGPAHVAHCLGPSGRRGRSLISGVEVTEEGWWPGSRPGSPFGVFSAQRRGAH